jgi:hypothetical protein
MVSLNQSLATVFLLLIVATFYQNKYVSPLEIQSQLKREPEQSATEKKTYLYNYRGSTYEIQEVANYEISGLVASHNNPYSFFDIYHNENSLDTLDVCLIWGENVKDDRYHFYDVSNGSFHCYFSYPNGVSFRLNQLSNNHLITRSEEVRKTISLIRRGDQIHIKGKLVNYQDVQYEGFRNSSLTREDTGDHACEVLEVEEIEILYVAHPWLRLFTKYGLFLFLFLLALKVYLFRLEAKQMISSD